MIPFACESPRWITLPNGDKLHVPCGHCASCVVGKGLERTNLLQEVLAGYPYQWFVTLTYDNDNLPLAKLSDSLHIVHPCDVDYNGVLHSVDFLSLDKNSQDFYFDCESKFGGVPVLSHKHITDFKKRLRYYLNKLSKDYETPFIYVCGEYGPTTLRPHYHFIFATKSVSYECVFKEAVFSAWQNVHRGRTAVDLSKGFVDVQRVVGKGSASYVAKYLNCTANLPSLLSRTVFRPFSQHASLNRILYERSPVCESEFVCSPKSEKVVLSECDGTACIVPVSNYLKNKFFPKYIGFGNKLNKYGVTLCSIITKFPSRQNFIDYCLACFGSAFQTFDGALKTLYHIVFDSDVFNMKLRLCKFYNISRRVLAICENLGLSLKDYALLHTEFYSKLSLSRLRRFYNMQVDLLKSGVPLCNLFHLYLDTDKVDICYYAKQFGVIPSLVTPSLSSLFPSQRAFEFINHGILKDTTKTKKRNDYFSSVGKVRRSYIPLLSKNKLSLLTKF